ncbi:MAG: helix-turn-helix domain-containing protein [Deltaproteobacteria bacterium]|nr:helix-turn-helix domain-containing protein [Deltaproteobacteria bacterium]
MVENFGEYLRTLRLEKRYSLREVEEKSGVSNSYLGLIERGQRPIPGADILKKLAPVYDVPVRDLLAAAGYLTQEDISLSEAEEIEMAFKYVMNDPRYKSGTRIKGGLNTEVKRFIVEMYEKATGKKLLPGG